MRVATTLLTARRLTDDVTVVWLMETPAIEDWDEIVEALTRYAQRCVLLALRGPGWFGEEHARSMTTVTVMGLRIGGIEVTTTDDRPLLRI
jgi:hypothetical protein